MRPKQKIALLLVTLLALVMVWPGVGWGSAALDAVNQLKSSGKMSNEYLNQSVIDLTYSSTGTVVAHTYMGINEDLTIKSFSVEPQENNVASDKIVRFIFTLTNQYRPETTIPVEVSQDHNTVNAYTYGTMKNEAVWAVVNGLPDCLGNPPINNHPDDDNDYSGGGGTDLSWTEKYYPEQITETMATATFLINSTTLMVNDASADQARVIEMDVAPEIKDDRTFVPVRFLAYSLGVDEKGIKWDHQTQTVTISKDNNTLGLKIGSDILTVNDEQQKMDVTPYIKQGRTMLPARWVAEPLGAKVGWDEITQQVTIEIPQNQEQGQ